MNVLRVRPRCKSNRRTAKSAGAFISERGFGRYKNQARGSTRIQQPERTLSQFVETQERTHGGQRSRSAIAGQGGGVTSSGFDRENSAGTFTGREKHAAIVCKCQGRRRTHTLNIAACRGA